MEIRPLEPNVWGVVGLADPDAERRIGREDKGEGARELRWDQTGHIGISDLRGISLLFTIGLILALTG